MIYDANDKTKPCPIAGHLAFDAINGDYVPKVFYYDTVTHECKRIAMSSKGEPLRDMLDPEPDLTRKRFVTIHERRELRFELRGDRCPAPALKR